MLATTMDRVSGDVFNSASLDREMLEFEKRQWIAELKIRTAREKRLEDEERCKEAKLCDLLVCDRIKLSLIHI